MGHLLCGVLGGSKEPYLMEVIDSDYDFYLTFVTDCLAANLPYTINSSCSSNAWREVGAGQCRLRNTTLKRNSLGCQALLDSRLQGGGCRNGAS